VTAAIAGLNHRHPFVTVDDQSLGKTLASGVFGSVKRAIAARFQEILERVPRQFMGELKGLDQPLLFQIRQPPLLRQLGCRRQLREGLAEALETLTPADIWSLGHGENQSERPCPRSINFSP